MNSKHFTCVDPLRKISAFSAPLVSVLLLVAAMQASEIEHPGILHKDDSCSSCHASKTSGKSVHSAMAIACTVCHLAQTQGDMTTLNLLMPKEQICFACHEKSMELQQHSPVAKGLCVDCHDSHSSNRRMLLRETDAGQPSSRMLPPHAESATRKAADQP